MKLRALIVDDQMLCREHLRRLLRDEPEVDVIGLCVNGREAIEAIRQHAPDVVFLDVQMPGLDGFEMLAQLKTEKMPAVIFVTAMDEYAVKAFEVHAVDYLVKPCDPARLKQAIARAKKQLGQHQSEDINERLATLADGLKKSSRGVERLAVKSNGRVLILKTEDINWVQAADNYVKLHLANESHLVRDTVSAVESKLPQEKFLRINRSTIVNIERIKELQPLFHGEYVVLLRDGTQLTLSRNYRAKLSQLGLL